MKRTIMMIALSLMAIFASNQIQAQTETEKMLLDATVAAMQKFCADISNQSEGVFNKCTCVRNGKDIVMDVYTGLEIMDFNLFDQATKDDLAKQIADSFTAGFMEGNDEESQLARKVFKEIGTKFFFNIYDPHNNKISTSVDMSKL